MFIGRTYVEAETLVFWPPDAKSWLIGKDLVAGKDWGQEKGMTEDEMVGWHHQLEGHWVWVNSGSWWWTGRLACCDSWGHKKSDMTEWLNWTELVMQKVLSLIGGGWWFTLMTPWTVGCWLLCPWDSPGKNTEMSCHFLLQGISPAQGSNPGLLHCRQILYPLSCLSRSCLFIFIFNSIILGYISEKIWQWFMSEGVLPIFSSRNFIVSSFTFRSLIHFELIFVYGVKGRSNFIFFNM